VNKRILSTLTVLVSLILSVSGCTAPVVKPVATLAYLTPVVTVTATPTPTPTPAPLTVTSKSIVANDTYVVINTVYPIISGMADITFQKTTNTNFKNAMNSRVSDLKSSAKSSHDADVAAGVEFSKFTLDGKMHIYRNNGYILSISVRMDAYYGGASSSQDSLFATITNTNPGKLLTIGDLFLNATTGKKAVNKKINDTIAAHAGDYFVSTVSVDSKTWFYITKTNLVVVFPEGDIAADVMGEPEFSIPLSAFSGNLIEALTH
jgi:hypothetical protein